MRTLLFLVKANREITSEWRPEWRYCTHSEKARKKSFSGREKSKYERQEVNKLGRFAEWNEGQDMEEITEKENCDVS